jgi:hypothetical protein
LKNRVYFCVEVKRVLIAILAFFYLGLASGIVMNLHYCMGKLSSVEYGYNEHHHCGKCGMEKKDGCCNTEFKVVKLQDSHQWTKSASISKKSFTLSYDYTHPSSFITPLYHEVVSIRYDSPPDRRTTEVYLHTNVFRI